MVRYTCLLSPGVWPDCLSSESLPPGPSLSLDSRREKLPAKNVSTVAPNWKQHKHTSQKNEGVRHVHSYKAILGNKETDEPQPLQTHRDES